MDFGVEKSIEEIIDRAEEERASLLQDIDILLNNKLPDIKEEFARSSDVFKFIANNLELEFSINDEMSSLTDDYIQKLNDLKASLLNMKINETTILNKEGSIIEESQKIVPLMLGTFGKLRDRFYNANKENLLNAFKEKKEIKSEKDEGKDVESDEKYGDVSNNGEEIEKLNFKKQDYIDEIQRINTEIAYNRGIVETLVWWQIGKRKKANNKIEELSGELADKKKELNKIEIMINALSLGEPVKSDSSARVEYVQPEETREEGNKETDEISRDE